MKRIVGDNMSYGLRLDSGGTYRGMYREYRGAYKGINLEPYILNPNPEYVPYQRVYENLTPGLTLGLLENPVLEALLRSR